MKKNPLRVAKDDSDRRLLADVERVGWHLVGIPEDSYVFSIGLYHSFDQPEIMIVGLEMAPSGRLLDAIGEQMRVGKQFRDRDIVDGIADGFPMGFRVVPEELYRSYLGYALWFYESHDFPVLQCVWPDKASRFPWDENCDEGASRLQRLVLPSGE